MLTSDLPAWSLRVFAFLFGTLWGSFFNVVIYRLPREISVVSPPSHCPNCKELIPAYRNIPIFGYLLLRGRAACCGVKLSPRYFFVELLTGVLALAVAERFLLGPDASHLMGESALSTLLYGAFVGGLLVATFIDLEWQLIPDEISIGGAALGLATVGLRHGGADAQEVALGAGGAFLFVQLLLVYGWEKLRGHRGMGEGDSKFLLFIGAFLGWKGAAFALFGGAFQGIAASAIAQARSALSKSESGEKPSSAPAAAEESSEKASAESDSTPDEKTATEGDAAPAADTDGTEAGDETEAEEETPPTLCTEDGTRAILVDEGRGLDIEDADGQLRWDYRPKPKGVGLQTALPFGPFLALGALEYLFFGDTLIEAYLELIERFAGPFS